MNGLSLKINSIEIIRISGTKARSVQIKAVADINDKQCNVDYAGDIIAVHGNRETGKIPTLTQAEREQIKNTLSIYAQGVLMSTHVTTYFEEASCERAGCELEE